MPTFRNQEGWKESAKKMKRNSRCDNRTVEWCPGSPERQMLQKGGLCQLGQTLWTDQVDETGLMIRLDNTESSMTRVVSVEWWEKNIIYWMSIAYLMSQDLVNTCYFNRIYVSFFHVWEGRQSVFSVPRIPGRWYVLNTYFLNEWLTWYHFCKYTNITDLMIQSFKYEEMTIFLSNSTASFYNPASHGLGQGSPTPGHALVLVHGLVGTGLHSRRWAVGKWAELRLYLQPLPVTPIAAWAPPSVRSAVVLDSYRTLLWTAHARDLGCVLLMRI